MTDRPTDLALAQIAAVFAADWPALERLYADDVRYRDPDGEIAGRSAVVGHLREQIAALPGCGYEIRRTYFDGGDGVVVEWMLSGPAGGPPIRLDVSAVYDFLDGRIVSERNYWDNAALLAQLESAPTTAVGW